MDQKLAIAVEVTGAQTGASQIKGVSTAVEGVGTATEKTSKQSSALRRTLSGLATGFAVYKGAQYIKGAVTETVSLAKATVGLQRITGMDAKTGAAWVEIAKERGVQSKQLNMGFISLSKQLVALQSGNKGAETAFQSLGFQLPRLQLQGKSTSEALALISDRFAALPNGANKAALAQKLFGRQAQALLPILNQGSGALHGQIEEMAKSTGITNASIKQSLQLVKTQREWSAAQTGLKVSIATALLPIVVGLTRVIVPLTTGFARLMQGSSAFRIGIIAVTAALVTFIVIAKAAALAGLEFDAAWGLIPALIIGIGVALVLLYQKCAWFRNAVNAAAAGVVAAFNWMKGAAVAVFNWIKGNWPLLVSILGGPIAAAVVQIVTHLHQIESVASSVFGAIKAAASAVGSVVSSALGGAFRAVSSAINGVVSGINAIVSTANKISGLPGKVLNVLTGGGGGGGIGGVLSSINPFHQHGGYMSHAGTAIVGEAGPEMLRLPQGAQVNPFMQSRGGGGGVIHTHVYLDRRQIALAIGDYTATQQAAR